MRSFPKPAGLSLCSVMLVMALLGVRSDAEAQSAVGSGPLTATLPDTEPTIGILSLGPVKLAPGITVRELGWDDNVFNEPAEESPKQDYVVSATPDISAYSRTRFLRLSAYAGADLTYYWKYDSERSTGPAYRGRADFLLSRVRPFVGAGHTRTRERPNGEIDVRADRVNEELSTGLAFDLSAHSLIYAAAYDTSEVYEDAVEDGVDLDLALSRDSINYQGGMKTDLTPLLSMQLYSSYQEDEFRSEPIRNGISKSFMARFQLAPDAMFTGVITAGYKDQHYADPQVKPYKGLVGNVSIAFSVLEVGRVLVLLQRGNEYSFIFNDAYYVENSGTLTYTHRLFGEVDLQGKIGRSLYDYSAREDEPPHKDTTDTAAGSLGYNLRNRTRIAVNYEYTRRRSLAISDRNYQRRRVFLSWLFAF